MARDRECADIKVRLAEAMRFAKQNRQLTSRTAMFRKMDIGINNQTFHKATMTFDTSW